jgi:isocitrate dehydrogenase kinase/phosphatase
MLWLYNQFSEAEIDVASYFSLAGDVNEIALDHLLLQKLISLEEPRKFSNNAITIRCISNYIGQKHQERKKEIADIWFQISTKILFENSTFNLNKLALFQSKQLFPTIIPNG